MENEKIIKITIALLITLTLSLAAFIPAFALSDDEVEILPGNPSDYQSGDVNLDGTVNTSDVVSIYNYIISSEESGILRVCADINGDGTVNSADVTGLYNLLTYGTPLGSKAYRQALVNAFK